MARVVDEAVEVDVDVVGRVVDSSRRISRSYMTRQRCFVCKQQGHMQADCPRRSQPSNDQSKAVAGQ